MTHFVYAVFVCVCLCEHHIDGAEGSNTKPLHWDFAHPRNHPWTLVRIPVVGFWCSIGVTVSVSVCVLVTLDHGRYMVLLEVQVVRSVCNSNAPQIADVVVWCGSTALFNGMADFAQFGCVSVVCVWSFLFSFWMCVYIFGAFVCVNTKSLLSNRASDDQDEKQITRLDASAK